MGSFSSLIDVSSFFIGILINLLLVAMICYYFKRKIDNLEMSQSEQAKMMYSLLQERENASLRPRESVESDHGSDTLTTEPISRKNVMLDLGMSTHSYLNNLDLSSLDGNNNIVGESNAVEEQEESDVESDSESEAGSVDNDTVQDELSDDEGDSNLKTIEVDDPSIHMEKPYEKMTVKELKKVIEERGITLTKKTLKKNEYIDILMNSTKQEESSESEEEEEELDEQSVEIEADEEENVTEVLSQPEVEEVAGHNEVQLDVQPEDNENIIESMQSQVESVLRRGDTINPRTFSLDLNLDAEVDILPEM